MGPVSALACPLVPIATGGGQGGGWSKGGPDLGSQLRAWTWPGRLLLRQEGQGWGLRVRVSGLSEEFILRFTLNLNN